MEDLSDNYGAKIISTSGTIRERLIAVADNEVIVVIPIGEETDYE